MTSAIVSVLTSTWQYKFRSIDKHFFQRNQTSHRFHITVYNLTLYLIVSDHHITRRVDFDYVFDNIWTAFVLVFSCSTTMLNFVTL